jgi:hypothetical protein
MRRGRHVARAAVSIVLALSVVTVAWAYFTTTGTGTASGNVTMLAAPTISSATSGAGTVALSWTAVTPPGSGTVTYYVTRDGGAPGGNCPSSSSPTSVTSCTDSAVSIATHHYTVTAVWRTWTATSTTSTVQVTFGPATHLLLSAATTTPAAGAGDNLTFTAKDASNNTVTTYTGAHNLTFAGASTIGTFTPTVTNSSGVATNFGAATAISFTSGVASVSGSSNGVMTLYKPETALITVTDGSITNGAGLSVTVGSAAAASFSPTAATTTPTAGVADNLTITAVDAYGNTATAYTGSHNLTFAGASTIGTNHPTVTSSSGSATNFGMATAISFTGGVASVSGSSNGAMTLYKAETALVTITDGSISNGSGLSVIVSAGTAASISLAAATTTPTAGTSDNLTITALDTYGNTASGYTGAHNLTFAGASTIGTFTPTVTNSSGVATNFGTTTAITFTNGVGSVSGSSNGVMTLYKAETALITVTDGSISNGAGLSVTVGSAAAVSFSPTAATTTPTPGVADNLTITALDAYGNAATAYTGSHNLTFAGASTIGTFTPTVTNSSGVATNFGTTAAITFTNGVGSVSGSSNGVMTLYKAETASITVTDGTITNGSGLSITVGSAAAASFSLTAATTTPGAGAADNLTITALDTYGNTASGYTGAHNLTFAGASTIDAFTPTVTNSSGVGTNFGTTTAITFTNGVASVSGSSNGVMKLYKAETAHVTVSDGAVNNGSGLSVTVAVAANQPNGLAYIDKNLVIADQVTGTTSASVGVTATETQGDHVGNTYTATSNTSGGFTINVEAYNGLLVNQTFTYSVIATDAYANQTAATTVTATDTK